MRPAIRGARQDICLDETPWRISEVAQCRTVVGDQGFAQAREATPYLAVPGDQLSVRVLDLPFTDPRKIDQVVGYELEGQIVHALEEYLERPGI